MGKRIAAGGVDAMHRWKWNKWEVVFWVIFASGVLLRVLAGTASLGFVHPDEHQQYLEVAQRIVHGYSVGYWEYDRGVRHYLYPGSLAATLWGLESIGIDSPVHQAMIIRVLLGIAVLASIALVARDWMTRMNVVSGLGLIGMASWSPDLIFIGARTLSETAMMIPLMLGIFLLDRRPVVSGAVLALMFAVRFQSAFLTAGLVIGLVLDEIVQPKSERPSRLWGVLVGLAGGLLVVGAIDWLTWGAWYHSPIEYFRVNILEGKAATFGVEPWYRYGDWTWDAMIEVSLFFSLLVLVGGWQQKGLALALLVFFVGHSMVSHKEPRFLWPVLPIVLSLAASGLGTIWQRLEGPKVRRAFLALIVLSLIPGVWFRYDQIDWYQEPTRSASLALARTGEYPNVTGVALFGLHDVYCGNYFYLRRNVPYLARTDSKSICADPKWIDGTINYLVTSNGEVGKFDASHLTRLEQVGTMHIYRVDHSRKTDDGQRSEISK